MLWGWFCLFFNDPYFCCSFTCAVYVGFVVTPNQGVKVIIDRPPPPLLKECNGLNVKYHHIFLIWYLYFENLCVARNRNNGIYFTYIPSFCLLPPGGDRYPQKQHLFSHTFLLTTTWTSVGHSARWGAGNL